MCDSRPPKWVRWDLHQKPATNESDTEKRKRFFFLSSLALSCPHFRHSVVSPLVSQFFLTYDLYIAAFAGAGITLLALVSTRLRAWPLAYHNEAEPLWATCSRSRGIWLAISYARSDCGPSVPRPRQSDSTSWEGFFAFNQLQSVRNIFPQLDNVMTYEDEWIWIWPYVCFFAYAKVLVSFFVCLFLFLFLSSWPMWSPPPITLQCWGTWEERV